MVSELTRQRLMSPFVVDSLLVNLLAWPIDLPVILELESDPVSGNLFSFWATRTFLKLM